MRLDLDGIPIGVMREKDMPTPLAACMMIAGQWELCRAEGNAGLVAGRWELEDEWGNKW